jgi:hypothetical protein
MADPQSCFCGKATYQVRCGDLFPGSCGAVCGKILGCGHHACKELCHDGTVLSNLCRVWW